MDVVIILTFIVCVYFVFEYFRLNTKIPQRSTKLISATEAQIKKNDETARQVGLLLNSQQFQEYKEKKSRSLGSGKENVSENETDIMKELK